MYDQEYWTDQDEQLAKSAWGRRFGTGGASWLIDPTLNTGRVWGGYANGLSTPDSRISIKNNAEYHGMELHAWQYLACGMHEEARDYFYCAALMRREDSELVIIGAIDEGHNKAIAICLKMARFSQAVGERGWELVVADDYGLVSEWIERRIVSAEEQLAAAANAIAEGRLQNP